MDKSELLEALKRYTFVVTKGQNKTTMIYFPFAVKDKGYILASVLVDGYHQAVVPAKVPPSGDVYVLSLETAKETGHIEQYTDALKVVKAQLPELEERLEMIEASGAMTFEPSDAFVFLKLNGYVRLETAKPTVLM